MGNFYVYLTPPPKASACHGVVDAASVEEAACCAQAVEVSLPTLTASATAVCRLSQLSVNDYDFQCAPHND